MVAFSVLFCVHVNGQDKKHIDSLELIYTQNEYDEIDKLKILNDLAINHFDTEKKLKYSTALIQISTQKKEIDYLLQGLLEKGNAYRLKSDYSEALNYYFKASRLASANSLNKRLTVVNIAIADVYAILGNKVTALKYYKKSISLLRVEKDSVNLASALLNVGDLYTNTGELQLALSYTYESEMIFKKLKSLTGLAYSLGNIGIIFAKLGNDTKAESNINEAIKVLEEQRDYYPICVYLMIMSDIYIEKKENIAALNYGLKSLSLAKKYGLKKEITDANFKLSKIYENSSEFHKSLIHFKEYTFYNDSIKNIESVKKIAEVQSNFEISKKQIEVDVLNQQKKNQKIITIASLSSLFLLFLLALGLYRRYQFVNKTNKIIEYEKNKSNTLLLNILPEETALELKESGKVLAKKFESVTVLFTDFVDFTHYAENLPPEKLVESVDYYFSKFDEIIEKFDLEKIKTVGDSYMCAGGLPYPTEDHAYKMILAAIEIANFVNESNSNNPHNDTRFRIRIGINTGPVVAGVVGTKKFAYDIWGDTVNIASRMETNSTPGKINISENTYLLVKNIFDCEYRGEVEVKNRGMMKMYFVNNILNPMI